MGIESDIRDALRQVILDQNITDGSGKPLQVAPNVPYAVQNNNLPLIILFPRPATREMSNTNNLLVTRTWEITLLVTPNGTGLKESNYLDVLTVIEGIQQALTSNRRLNGTRYVKSQVMGGDSGLATITVANTQYQGTVLTTTITYELLIEQSY